MHIRIVPMSMYDSIFVGKSIEEIQNWYFKDHLVNFEKGWYWYAKSGLNSSEGDLLLFQMQNQIIASAYLKQVLTFKKMTEDGCKGALLVDDVKVFKPIDKEELSTLINDFKSFNQAKQDFDSKNIDMDKLYKRLQG